MGFKLLFFLLIAMVFSFSILVNSQTPNTLIILDFENKGIPTIALENIAKLENLQSQFNIKISTEKDTFVLGEVLNFTLVPDKDCYVLLFDIGTSGKIHLLFPNKNQPKNFVKAGEKIVIENIRVSPPIGTEMVKAIATLDSVSFDKMMDLASSPATFQSFGDDVDQFSQDLEVMVSPLSNDRWTTDMIQLEIKEK